MKTDLSGQHFQMCIKVLIYRKPVDERFKAVLSNPAGNIRDRVRVRYNYVCTRRRLSCKYIRVFFRCYEFFTLSYI